MLRPTLVILFLLSAILPAQDGARLLRFPHREGDRIVFVKGGDLFAGTVSGRRAWRLTSFGDGQELFPRLSPDGEWVAFSGEYSGSRQIFVIPFAGGEPRQLGFYPDVGPMPPRGGYDNLPYDWTPDGKKILCRMNRTPYGQRVGRYYLVDPFAGGLEQPLAVPEGGAASFSPDGTKLAMNLISREWRTWKRYRAGRAQDVWIYDLAENEARRLTSWEGTDSQPLWLGDRIYFVSDRTGTLNIWVHDLESGEERAVTRFQDRDVTFPSRGRQGLVFECDGAIWAMAAGTEAVARLDFEIVDDRPHTRPVWKEATRPGDFDLSPEAREILVEFRGDLFRVFGDGSEPRRLDTPPNRREREPRWSPDGRFLAYLAEVGDDYEIFLRERTSGGERERQLTAGTGAWILDFGFSPDARSIAVTDRAGRLRLVDVESGTLRDLDRAEFGGLTLPVWSADSSRLAWSKAAANGLASIHLAARDGGAVVRVTGEEWRDSSPAFDPEGRYLWFVSARDFDYDSLDFQERVYGLLLRRDLRSPLDFETREEPLPKDEAASRPAAETKEEDGAPALVIDLEGLADREFVLPLPPGRYGALHGEKEGLLMRQGGDLVLFDLAARERKTVLEGVGSYRVAAREAKLAYASGSGLCIAARRPGQKKGADPIPVTGIRVRVDPPAEWRQMFHDAWRIVRDWFYDPRMHGVDWLAVRGRYEPLLDHMTHRGDLDFILGEMIAELNVGHAYVQSGEEPRVERAAAGCLGCELVKVADGYRVGRIFAAENWTEDGRNPLREPGVAVTEGDYVLAIDGVPLPPEENPYRLLEGKVGRKVTLRIASSPMTDDARDVVVRPCASEQTLLYLDWVARNRARVEERSGGRIGYIHVPNTAVEGHRRFYEGLRAYARTKEGLIVDDRYNGGGFIPDRMAEVLTTRPLNFWARRGSELQPEPDLGYAGKSVMLLNGYSSSGGDAFPFYYRELGGGPLIGTRTWGGLVGISFEPGLVDGGRIKVPAFAFVDPSGRWAVEAEGVAPDIEVVDDPGARARGEEPVLDAAIDHLLGELEKGAPTLRPPVPAGPERSK